MLLFFYYFNYNTAMSEIIPYYKPLGLTPLQAIHKLTTERPELKQFPITYAGRLDPMAEGLLLLLVGDGLVRSSIRANDDISSEDVE